MFYRRFNVRLIIFGANYCNELCTVQCSPHKGPFTNYVSTLDYLVGQPNANLVLVDRSYLVKVLTRLVGWSKNYKIVLT